MDSESIAIMGIEQTLLEYYKTTDKSWKYSIKHLDSFPDDAMSMYVRSVCINKIHIHFYEAMEIENASSTILWMLAV